MSSSDGGSIALGLVLVVVAGVLNGSWNASFSPGVAVGPSARHKRETSSIDYNREITANEIASNTDIAGNHRTNDDSNSDLDFPLAWALFQAYAVVLNLGVCLLWAGGAQRTGWILSQASFLDIGSVLLFGLLWGIGSVGFGVACRMAGVGLGTNLTMGVIMILGTLLPLLLEKGLVRTASGAVILTALVICSAGLAASMSSLQTRDVDEAKVRKATTTESGVVDAEAIDEGELEKKITAETHAPQYSTLQKVMVCIVAGVFATQLQFAFVFGGNLIDLAESSDGPGSTTPSGASAVVWLLAISVSAPVSIAYGLYTTTRPWRTVRTCPWYRHVLLLSTTSVPWVAHIHLYGYSNSTLPEELAASVSWPILMMVTVTTGMVWSIALGEWKDASRLAWYKLGTGMVVIAVGVILLMASIAV